LTRAIELKPSLNLRAKDLLEIERIISKYEGDFLMELPDQFDEEYEELMREIKLALVFAYWMNEVTEEKILEKFGVTPGELHSRLEIADWLLYSLLEIGKIILISKIKMRKIREIRKRLYYGIKTELLNLVKLEGIGRVRARILFNAGFRNLRELKKASLSEIAKILKSRKLAEKVKSQIS
jgi:helicase